MSRKFIDYPIDAPYLLPPDLDDWLPEDHLARFIKELVQKLDLESFYQFYDSKDGRGRPPYHPAMMLSLLLYGYSTGVFSSRKIERATYENLAFRFLSANLHPDHTSIASFRTNHLEALKDVFVQVVLICQDMGLVKLGHVSIDGTKIRASASKRKSLRPSKLRKLIKKQRKKMAELLEKAKQADEDDATDDHRLEDEVKRAKRRLEKLESAHARVSDLIREAQEAEEDRNELKSERKSEMEAERQRAKDQRQAAGAILKQARLSRGLSQKQLATLCGLDFRRLSELEMGKRQPQPDEVLALEKQLEMKMPVFSPMPPRRCLGELGRKPRKKEIRENLTDPDSRLMKPRRNAEYVQAYNPQAAVDANCQIILAAEMSNSANDKKNLIPILTKVKAVFGRLPDTASADTGYSSARNYNAAELDGVNLLIPPERRRKNHKNSNPTLERMRAKLEEPENKHLFRQRSQIVEPPFARIKHLLGFDQFMLRGTAKVSGEWKLLATVHNILKLVAYG